MKFLKAPKVLIALGILAALALFLSHSNQPKKADAVRINGTVVSRDKTQIAFTKIGSGPPVVIVDGAFCYRENGPSTDLAGRLAQNFTVYTYDRRGRGESSDQSPYSIQAEIDDLASLVGHTGGPVFAVGISSGGALAMQAAASGVPIRKLLLYEPPFISDNGVLRSFADKRAQAEKLIASGDTGGAVRYFLTDIFGAPKAFALVMPFVMPGNWRRCKSVARTIPYDLTILDDGSILGARSTLVTAPTLVVTGERSPNALRDAAQLVAHALPHGQVLILPGQDHNFQAKVVSPVIADFFDKATN